MPRDFTGPGNGIAKLKQKLQVHAQGLTNRQGTKGVRLQNPG